MTDDFLKKQERFFALAGYAITRWAYIDRNLFDFCKFALGTTDHKTAIVFYRTPSGLRRWVVYDYERPILTSAGTPPSSSSPTTTGAAPPTPVKVNPLAAAPSEAPVTPAPATQPTPH
jgi:hypothetical protein